MGGAFLGILEVNAYADRDRAMYHDTLLMAGLQYDLLRAGRPGYEVTVDESSGTVYIGEVAFETLPGVTVVVEEREDGEMCVQGRNEHGSETEWECVDGTGTRPDLGAVEGEFGDE